MLVRKSSITRMLSRAILQAIGGLLRSYDWRCTSTSMLVRSAPNGESGCGIQNDGSYRRRAARPQGFTTSRSPVSARSPTGCALSQQGVQDGFPVCFGEGGEPSEDLWDDIFWFGQ